MYMEFGEKKKDISKWAKLQEMLCTKSSRNHFMKKVMKRVKNKYDDIDEEKKLLKYK